MSFVPRLDGPTSPDRSRTRTQYAIENGPRMAWASISLQSPIYLFALYPLSYSVNIPRDTSTTKPQPAGWFSHGGHMTRRSSSRTRPYRKWGRGNFAIQKTAAPSPRRMGGFAEPRCACRRPGAVRQCPRAPPGIIQNGTKAEGRKPRMIFLLAFETLPRLTRTSRVFVYVHAYRQAYNTW